MSDKITEALQQAADFFGCHPDDFADMRLVDVFREAEQAGAVVYWGCWTAAELDIEIPSLTEAS